MSEIYPALVPQQDAQGNLLPDANGNPAYPAGSPPTQTLDLRSPQAVLVTANGAFNVPGWNDGPHAVLRVVVSRYIGIGTWGYQHYPYLVRMQWPVEQTLVAPAFNSAIIHRPASYAFRTYDRPAFHEICEPGSVIPGTAIVGARTCPTMTQQMAQWQTSPWNDDDLYDSWVAAGSPEMVLAEFHESSPKRYSAAQIGVMIGASILEVLTLGAATPIVLPAMAAAFPDETGHIASNIGREAQRLPGNLEALPGNIVDEVVRVGTRIGAEITRIPANVVNYVQNPRAFMQAVAADMQNGWGAPLLLFLGPGAAFVLVSMQAGADAHNLHDFAAVFSRQLAGGTAMAFVGTEVGLTGIFTPDAGYSNLTPLSSPVVNSIIIPNDAVKDSAKVAAYVDGILPFFPQAIEDLAVLAQHTSQERLALESKLQQLKAQILKNGAAWYVAAQTTVKVLTQVATLVATLGAATAAEAGIEYTNMFGWPMMLAEALLTPTTTVLQMVTAHQTLIDVRRMEEERQAQEQAAAQAELDAIQRQIDAINAQIAAARRANGGTQQTSSQSQSVAPSGGSKTLLWIGLGGIGLLLTSGLMQRRSRRK